jgi:hypothetical protein
MEAHNVSVRELSSRLDMRDRRKFMNRLEAGTLFHTEIYACLDALKIDQARAYIAIHHLQDPDRYFSPVCETLALLSDNLTTTLVEYEAACQGDFQPIREGIARHLVKQLGAQLVAHQATVRRAQEAVSE